MGKKDADKPNRSAERPGTMSYDNDTYPFTLTVVGNAMEWGKVRASVMKSYPQFEGDEYDYPVTGAKVMKVDDKGRLQVFITLQDDTPEHLTHPRISKIALLAHEAEHILDWVLDSIKQPAPQHRDAHSEVRGYLMQFIMLHMLAAFEDVREDFAWLGKK